MLCLLFLLAKTSVLVLPVVMSSSTSKPPAHADGCVALPPEEATRLLSAVTLQVG